jgi:hypothetical protein
MYFNKNDNPDHITKNTFQPFTKFTLQPSACCRAESNILENDLRVCCDPLENDCYLKRTVISINKANSDPGFNQQDAVPRVDAATGFILQHFHIPSLKTLEAIQNGYITLRAPIRLNQTLIISALWNGKLFCRYWEREVPVLHCRLHWPDSPQAGRAARFSEPTGCLHRESVWKGRSVSTLPAWMA